MTTTINSLTDTQSATLAEMLCDADAELQNRLELDDHWDEDESEGHQMLRATLVPLLAQTPAEITGANRPTLTRAYLMADEYLSTTPVNRQDAERMRAARQRNQTLATELGLG